MNDSSVSLQHLASDKGTEVPLKDLSDDNNMFTQHGDEFEVLDVER
jgi:hypothetical protein